MSAPLGGPTESGDFHREDWVRDGQRYYLANPPWVEQRTWNYIGIETGVAPPAGFNPTRCLVETAR